jgi:hypothetical protein
MGHNEKKQWLPWPDKKRLTKLVGLLVLVLPACGALSALGAGLGGAVGSAVGGVGGAAAGATIGSLAGTVGENTISSDQDTSALVLPAQPETPFGYLSRNLTDAAMMFCLVGLFAYVIRRKKVAERYYKSLQDE